MGIVFGVTGTKEPSFKLLKSGSYCVREYEPFYVAEVLKTKAKDRDGAAFRQLAAYIGVFGEPQNLKNDKPQPIAMTAPVISKVPSVDLQSTRIMSGDSDQDTLRFVLPSDFKDISDIPVPMDDEIKIKHVPSRVVAVKPFSGWYSDDAGKRYLDLLKQELEDDHFLSTSDAVNWEVAQYHPPFTLPFLRRNEIWIDLDRSHVQACLSEDNSENKASEKLNNKPSI